MRISMVIPAKGHSTRLENKNLCKIKGRSLVELVCEKALSCESIDNVYLDTESEKILDQVAHLTKQGLRLINRPLELANNDISANDLLVYALHAIEPCDLLLQTFATSPLIKASTIDDVVAEFLSMSNEYDSFFTVVPTQEYNWSIEGEPLNFDLKKLPNSYQLPKVYQETHGLYGIFTKTLLSCKTRVGRKPMLIPISKLEAIDVNDLDDINIVRALSEYAR